MNDNSKLLHLQEALELADREWRKTFDSISDAVWILDSDCHIVHCNNATADLFGQKPQDVIGRHCWEIAHSTDAQLDICPVLRMRRTLRRESMEFQFDKRWFHVTVDPILDEASNLTGIVHIMRDITERKLSEARLQASQTMLSTIINSIPQSIFWKDRNSVYLGCNDVFAKAVGISNPEEIIGKTDYDLPWPSEEAKAYIADDKEVINNNQPKRHIIEPLRQADGTRLLIDTTKLPLLDAQGNVIGLLGVYEDITESTLTQDKLTESRQMLELILDTFPVRVFWKDRNSVFLGCNRAFAADAGLTSAEDLINRTDYDMTWRDQAEIYRADDKIVMETGQPKMNYEEPQTTPDGRTIWLQTSKIPLIDADGQIVGVMGTYEDITERKHAEAALRESEEKYRWLIQNTRAAIVVHGPATEVRAVNPVAQELLGLSEDQMLARTALDPDWHFLREDGTVMPIDDYPVNRVITTKQPLRNMIYGVRHPGKRDPVWVVVDADPVFDDRHEISEVIVSFMDITERRNAERAIQDRQARIDSIFRAAPIGIGMVIDRTLTEVNDHLCEMIGYSREDLIGQNARMLYPSQADFDTVGCVKYAQIAKYGTGTVETRMQRKDSSIIDVILSSTPLDRNDLSQGVTFTVLDITERKKAEAALRESEETYRNLVETTETGYLVVDTQSYVVDANAEYIRLTGHESIDDICGRSVLEWTAEYDIERNMEEFKKCAETGKVRNLEIDYVSPDGSTIIPIEINATLIETLQGPMILTLCRDITERRRAEEALQLRGQIIEQIHDSVVATDLDGKITSWNKGAERLLGYTANEAIGKSISFVYPEELQDFFRNEIVLPLLSKGEHEVETWCLNSTGQYLYVQLLLSLLKDRHERPIGMIGYAIDITERKRAKEALEESEQRFRAIVESAPDGIFIADRTGRFIEVNEGACQQLGYSRDELLNMTIYDVVAPSEIEHAGRRLAAMKSEPAFFDSIHVRKDGTEFPIELSIRAMQYRGMPAIAAIVRDVSERKKTEEEKKIFYRDTILSVTEGKLKICDAEEVLPYVESAQVRIEVNNAETLAMARNQTRNVCTEAGLNGDRLDEFVIAAGEAITNAVKHAGTGCVYAGTSDGAVWVCVADTGKGIDSLILPKVVLQRGFSTKRSLGLGYSIMLSIADRVFLNTGASGTTVVLIKNVVAQEPVMFGIIDEWDDLELTPDSDSRTIS